MPPVQLPTVPALDDPQLKTFVAFLRFKAPVVPPKGVDRNDYQEDLHLHQVPVAPQPGYQELHCWYNCLDLQAKHGGEAIFGWALWNTEGQYIAQHHAVWLQPNGQFIDPTPNQSRTESILFMPDGRASFDLKGLRSPASLKWWANDDYCWAAGDLEKEHYFICNYELQESISDWVQGIQKSFS